ncbi:hypothetical protein EIN_390340 [Entamoeba invadens IP1]|uniref:Uncharacterized protein n=1 Tax=Entamoeba invadens IP1 TaxID=370355 RepID=A0A0A1U554_ENTIV|nr:hypothetical protein EIN_390340 [Entamoeba invadens IP1]ELP89419.1 hypothetical protein EIN_390340 [Entamoeba invadens IP1]|eukprot:XP_004256190.1 hypothetical protein EIN_390340 [Entamoeba invadens IP1]
MLYNLRILTETGALLYEKTWTKVVENIENFRTMIPQLFSAMMRMAQSSMGMSLRFISVGGISVSMSNNTEAGLICYVFYDEDDGEEVGQFVSEAVLREFMMSYQIEDVTSPKLVEFKQQQKTSLFLNFSNLLVNAIRKAIKSVLTEFKKKQGILSADIIEHEKVTGSETESTSGGVEIIANIKTMVPLIDSIMSLKNMGNSIVTFVEFTTNRLVVQKVRTGCLVVVGQKNIAAKILETEIKKYATMVETIQGMVSALQ